MDYDFDKTMEDFDETVTKGRPVLYPFRECPVDHSFFVEGRTSEQVGPLCAYWNKKLSPRKFIVRAKNAKGERETKNGQLGVRVYRVK